MRLVEATEDDVGTLAGFWFSLATENERYSRFNELVDDASETADEGFRNLLADDDTTVFLLVEDETEVGYTIVRRGRHPSREYGDYVKVVDLFVATDHRNQGYGTEAIERVKALASAQGSDHLKVSCEWENDGARRLYRETGFEEKQVTFVQELD